MSITIASFDGADRAAVDEAYRIGSAANDADLPDFPPLCRRRFDALFHTPMPGTRSLWALARLDGVPAGYLQLDLPQLDNTDNATVELLVHPELPASRRRPGAARVRGAPARASTAASGWSGWPSPRCPAGRPEAWPATRSPPRPEPSPRWPRCAAGSTSAQLDRAALGRRSPRPARGPRATSRSAGRGATPQEYVADVAYLDGRLLMDAPMGDVQWEPEQVDAERIRGNERALDARGRRRYHLGVRHEASGRLVAWTLLDVGATADWHAFQQITIVDPAHRGHRLGLIAKVENLQHVLTHEPAVRVIDTWNAAGNSYMIAINEPLGFRPVDAWTNWQLTL